MPDISSPPERTEELVERMARAMLAVDGSWQGISWERVPDAVQALFLRNARAALQSLGYAEMERENARWKGALETIIKWGGMNACDIAAAALRGDQEQGEG